MQPPEGVAGAIPSDLNYPSRMRGLTRFRRDRIRVADSADIARMSEQEAYWTSSALKAILNRIEILSNEEPQEALKACSSATELLERTLDASPDLHALTLAVHAAVLRRIGEPEVAITQYESALQIKNLTSSGRGDVLARMAVTQVYLGYADKGLEAIEQSLELVQDKIPVLAVRGWVRMFTNPLEDALDDCLKVLQGSRGRSSQNYSLLAAIVNAANILSYVVLEVDQTILDRLQTEIDAYRKILPTGGSSYLKSQRARLLLSRAEGLLLTRRRTVDEAEAKAHLIRSASLLQRSAEGFREKHPDDGLDTYTDLICILSKLEQENASAQAACEAFGLLDRVSWRVDPIARNALLSLSKRGAISYGQALELKTLLRRRNFLP